MKRPLLSLSLSITLLFSFHDKISVEDWLVTYEVDLSKQHLEFFTRDGDSSNFVNHGRLKDWLKTKGKELIFATNGGMYNRDLSPQGLYIENGKLINKLDTVTSGYGNFYLSPNGVFYIKNNKGVVTTTQKFKYDKSIKYATQSGPMLLINGAIHNKFREGSSNLHIRNAVGVLPNGNLLFAQSKQKINFYDLATYFKKRGCKNALYLDGFVSRTYLPAKNWKQTDGVYGIIIAEIK